MVALLLLTVATLSYQPVSAADESPTCVTTDTDLVSQVEAKVERHASETGRADLHEMFSRSLQTMKGNDDYAVSDIKARPDKQGEKWQGAGPNPLWQAIYKELDRLQACRGEPTVTVTGGNGITEGDKAMFTVSADPAPQSPLAVSITVSQNGNFDDNGATGTTTVTVPTSGSVTHGIPTVDDGVDEPDGSINIALNGGDGYKVGSPSSAVIPVSDNDDPPPMPTVIIIAGNAVTEGGVATFTVSAAPVPSTPLTVSLSVSQSGDYAAQGTTGNKSVVIPTSGAVAYSVATVDDNSDEPNGSITVAIGNGNHYRAGSNSSATVNVSDNDETPAVTVAGGDTVTEGEPVTFTFTATPAPAATLTVNVTTNITYGDTVSHKVQIPASGAATFTLATDDDTLQRDDATAVAIVKAGDGYNVGTPSHARVTVTDNDEALPVLAISNGPNVTEGSNATFTIAANPKPKADLDVSVSISQQGDFLASGQSGRRTVTVPTSGTATFTAATEDDNAQEDDGVISARLHASDDYHLIAEITAAVGVSDNDDAAAPAGNDPNQPTLAEAFVASVEEFIVQPTIEYSRSQQVDPAPDKAVTPTLKESVTSLEATGRTTASITLQWPNVPSADSYYVSLTRRDDISDKHEGTTTNLYAVFRDLETNSQYLVNMIPKQGKDFLFNDMPQPILTSTLPPDAVIYVVDDSGSMDGDWPEVRTALREVRDTERMPKVKVALIAFGTNPKVFFGLTEHEDAPWDSHIDSLGGYKGGTNYSKALQAARTMLNGEPLNNKKIVFMSDSQLPVAYFQGTLSQLVKDGIVVDTVFFGQHYEENKGAIQKISTDTGGTHEDVPKPSTGTVNTPPVTTRALEDIVYDLTDNIATTLYAFDSTFSLHIGSNAHIENFFKGFARALGKIKVWPKASVLMSRFAGENDLSNRPTDAYRLQFLCNVNGGLCDGKQTIKFVSSSTNLDNAVAKSLVTIKRYAKSGDAKRVVLITDGISPNKPTAATLAKYIEDGTCLDVVALGAHADRVYLKGLADTPNLCGDFHVAK